MYRPAIAMLVAALSLAAPSAPARACQVPVFRYALERWEPEPFDLLVVSDAPLPGADRDRVDRLRARVDAEHLNVAVSEVRPDDPGIAARWKQHPGASLPWVAVRSPRAPERPVVWEGPLGSPELEDVLRSPAREEIARHLLAGDSAVWVLVESDDPARNRPAAELLERELDRLEAGIELPVPDPNDPAGERMLSDLPLRLAFPVVRVARSSRVERPFVRMLLDDDEKAIAGDEPVLVPVFGRGRALAWLAGKDLSADRIEEAGVFLAGACSCQVKDLNPGYDLLMGADWQSVLSAAAGPGPAPSAQLAAAPREVAPREVAAPVVTPREVAAASLPPAPRPAPRARPPAAGEGRVNRAPLVAATAACGAAAVVLGLRLIRRRPRRGADE